MRLARAEALKFGRLQRFGEALPRLRARVDRDLRRTKLSRNRVVACVVRLIDEEFLRVGNSEYARRNGSFGATTLRRRHVTVTRDRIELDFPGKSHRRQRAEVRDARIARVMQRLLEMPGHEVFRFFDEDDVIRGLRSRHVNAYVKRHLGEQFTAKDFRTWGGTVAAARVLLDAEARAFKRPRSRAAVTRAAVVAAADRLGNTPAVARSAYIHPGIIEYAEHPRRLQRMRELREQMRPRPDLSVDEQIVLAMLAAISPGNGRGRRS